MGAPRPQSGSWESTSACGRGVGVGVGEEREDVANEQRGKRSQSRQGRNRDRVSVHSSVRVRVREAPHDWARPNRGRKVNLASTIPRLVWETSGKLTCSQNAILERTLEGRLLDSRDSTLLGDVDCCNLQNLKTRTKIFSAAAAATWRQSVRNLRTEICLTEKFWRQSFSAQ